MNLTEHTRIRIEKFGTVVFDTLTEKIFITGEIGSEILQLIEQGKHLPEIVSELGGIFDGLPIAIVVIAQHAQHLGQIFTLFN